MVYHFPVLHSPVRQFQHPTSIVRFSLVFSQQLWVLHTCMYYVGLCNASFHCSTAPANVKRILVMSHPTRDADPHAAAVYFCQSDQIQRWHERGNWTNKLRS